MKEMLLSIGDPIYVVFGKTMQNYCIGNGSGRLPVCLTTLASFSRTRKPTMTLLLRSYLVQGPRKLARHRRLPSIVASRRYLRPSSRW